MSDQLTSKQLLAQQLLQLQALEKLINDEKEILQQHSPEALIKVTNQKNELLISIQSLDSVIEKNEQFALDKSSGSLQKELADIETLLLDCQEKNQINGLIIQQSQLAVERMKTSLLENSNRTSVTYDSKGKKSGGLSSLGIKA